MQKSRTRNAKRNIVFGILNRISMILFPFIIRTAILYILGSEYLGLDSLFSSILNFLSLAELGVGNALVYSMYKPIAENDSKMICALLNLYRRLYRYIGTFIFGAGVFLVPFLPRLVKGDCPPDINLYILYMVYLTNTSLTYWMYGYKVSLLSAHQRSDVESKTIVILHSGMYLLQIGALFLFRNYYWYILWLPVYTIINNMVISRITDRMYPDYKCYGEVSKEKQIDIKKKVLALFGTKANSIVLHAMDNIVISAFLGLSMVGIYGNYYYIMAAIVGMISIVYRAMTAGIGNSLETETVEKNYFDFNVLTFANFWLVSFCSISLLCLYQPFMKIWVHEENMFDMLVVLLLVIYFYIYQIRRVVLTYKDAGGIWWEDRYRPYISMAVNLIGNYIMVQVIGIYGVVLSTIFSMLISIPIENYTVFKYIFHISPRKFYLKNCIYVIVSVSIGSVTYLICSFAPEGIRGLMIRAAICMIIPNSIIIMLYHKTKEFRHARKLLIRR